MAEHEGESTPGAALRDLRRRRGATLKDFSELTGYPISTLSKLENGKLGMSYQRLLKLSRSLEIDVTELMKKVADVSSRPDLPRPLTETPPPFGVGRREITRAGEGPIIKTQVYEYRYPASDLKRKTLNPIIVDVTARSIDEFEDLMRHPGEEYAIVMEGTVDFHCDHYRPTHLEKGDSIYFDGNMGHAYIAVGDAPCRVLTVCSAPLEDLIEARSRFELPRPQLQPAKIAMAPVVVGRPEAKRAASRTHTGDRRKPLLSGG